MARTNQNQKDEWRHDAPPLIFLVLCPKQNLHCDKIDLGANLRLFASEYHASLVSVEERNHENSSFK